VLPGAFSDLGTSNHGSTPVSSPSGVTYVTVHLFDWLGRVPCTRDGQNGRKVSRTGLGSLVAACDPSLGRNTPDPRLILLERHTIEVVEMSR
jgi:hypothetical protein